MNLRNKIKQKEIENKNSGDVMKDFQNFLEAKSKLHRKRTFANQNIKILADERL